MGKKGLLEKEIQNQITNYLGHLQARKYLIYYRIYNGPRIAGKTRKVFLKNPSAGLPDLVILPKNYPAIWAELKTAIGVLTPDQKAFQAKAKEMGHISIVWRSLDDCISFLEGIGIFKDGYDKYDKHVRGPIY